MTSLPTLKTLRPHVRAGFDWLTAYRAREGRDAAPVYGDTPDETNADGDALAQAIFDADTTCSPTTLMLAINHARWAFRVGWSEYEAVAADSGPADAPVNRAARRTKRRQNGPTG